MTVYTEQTYPYAGFLSLSERCSEFSVLQDMGENGRNFVSFAATAENTSKHDAAKEPVPRIRMFRKNVMSPRITPDIHEKRNVNHTADIGENSRMTFSSALNSIP